MSSSRQPIQFWLKIFCAACFLQSLILAVIIAWFSFRGCPEQAKSSLEPSTSPSTYPQHQESDKARVFVAVLSHSSRRDRRDAIRDTWFSFCKERPQQIHCRFFTDEVGLDDKAKSALQLEIEQKKDMELLNTTDNFAFAERLLLIWEWSTANQLDYDYFLRIDDDHFLCVDRLIYELQHRPNTSLYWGFIHCHPRLVRVDEAWLMLSKDLVQEIMDKRANQTLLCHPYGDQAVAMWINLSSKNITYFMDNKRIVHKSAGKDQTFYTTNICEKYLSLHGTYPKSMRRFWLLFETLRKEENRIVTYKVPKIVKFGKLCQFSPMFDYKAFLPEYQFEPKLCHLQPTWSISNTRHGGREVDGERYSYY